MRLLIRADAGEFVGTGHVMRMIAFAQAYMRRGGQVALASVECPQGLVPRMVACGIDYRSIQVENSGGKEDADATIALADELDAQWIVTDGYHFDYDYQKRMKGSGHSLLCLDDHGYSDRWCCDVILNQNLDAEKKCRYANDISAAKLLLGADFCLLRQEFLDGPGDPKEWRRVENLLLTLGGSDAENATEATLRLLNTASERPLVIRVLLGINNPHLERLRALESHHTVEILTNVTDMPAQYAWADGIISAGGSTCWEWLYYGLPGAIVTIADNQLPIIQALTAERKAALPLGWFSDFNQVAQGQPLSHWLDAPNSELDMNAAISLIDGMGADRVAAVLSGGALILRPLRGSDIRITWQWANEKTAREMSFNTEAIAYRSHVPWFKNQLVDKEVWVRVIESNKEGPVGIIRFERQADGETAVVSVNLSKSVRGKGYGTDAIKAATRIYCVQINVSKVIAYAKPENMASCRTFLKAGYSVPKSSRMNGQPAVMMTYLPKDGVDQ